jgi:hypothetical protein
VGAREPLRIRPQTRVDRILSSSQRIDVGAIGGDAGRHLGTFGDGAVAGDQYIDVPGGLSQPVTLSGISPAQGESQGHLLVRSLWIPVPVPMASAWGRWDKAADHVGYPKLGTAVFAEVRAKKPPKMRT